MGAGVMFQKDGKALLLRRSKRNKDEWGGYWNFPGGTTEIGESPYETAIRESREEVGPLPPFKVYNHVSIRGYTLFLAEVSYQFTPRLNSEHTEWEWVDLSDIESYPLHIKDKKTIRKAPMPKRKEEKATPPAPVPPPQDQRH